MTADNKSIRQKDIADTYVGSAFEKSIETADETMHQNNNLRIAQYLHRLTQIVIAQ